MNPPYLRESGQPVVPPLRDDLRWIDAPMTQDSAPVARRRVVVTNPYGLHLRPAEKFVSLAGTFVADVRIHYDGQIFNGKSILDLMTLAAECGAAIEVEAQGADAEAAVNALAELVLARFHEANPYGDLDAKGSTGSPTDSAGPPGGPAS